MTPTTARPPLPGRTRTRVRRAWVAALPAAVLATALVAPSPAVAAPTVTAAPAAGAAQPGSGTAGDPADAVPGLVAEPAAAPRPARTRTLALTPAAPDVHEVTRTSTGGPFHLAAVTWPAGQKASVDVTIRVRTATGWSAWTELASDDDHAPDPGARTTARRAGTAPYVTAAADAVQVRVRSADELPAGLRLETIDPGTARAPSAATTLAAAPATPAATATDAAADAVTQPTRLVPTQPTILSRAAWGADEKLRGNYGEDIWYGQIKGAFVHHTASANGYAASEVPAIIRSIYRYHVLSRGWDDIGYNFLVDRFGRVWEGAYGGIDKPVVGAHTQYYNSSSFAMSAIGDFTSVTPSQAVLDAYSSLFAWKLGLAGVWDPQGTTDYTYPGSRDQRTISGHRDAKATACPGQRLYDRIGTIRSGVERRMAAVPARLTLDGPAVSGAGERSLVTAQWARGDVPVDGKVNLQRWTGRTWEHVRQLTVVDGVVSTWVTPSATRSFRLRASSATLPVNVATSGTAGTSNTLTTTVTRTSPSLELDGPAVLRIGDKASLTIRWWAGGPVDGAVNLQRRSGSSWVHVRQITVQDGTATTTLTPGASNAYRLRASRASTPPGVPLTDPLGTSNTYAVTAYPRDSAPFVGR